MLQQAIQTLITLLPPTAEGVTPDQITANIDWVLTNPAYRSVERDALLREITTLYNIRADPWMILEDRERNRPWLDSRRGGINWHFWNRYSAYLRIHRTYAPDTLLRLDRLTDTILDRMFDPDMAAGVSKRGLVVGQVQSGKTANYTGLICKAADAGYKMIIVLAGIHNNLRAQTQLRLDEDFLGRDSLVERNGNNTNGQFGVSRIQPGLVAHSITSSADLGDFSAQAFRSLNIGFETGDPILVVAKKNTRVLSYLYRWLASKTDADVNGHRQITAKSLLLIDDEADHASINTSATTSGTRINSQIRDILRLFYKSAYVGYTATPFANLFVSLDEDDIFPRDFIVNLPAPSNYIGPERVFGFQPVDEDEDSDTVLPIVRRIDDFGALVPQGRPANSPRPDALPESLRLAIRSYLLVCAIRRLRGQVNVHNSMLIHVTRYNAWQLHVRELVDEVFDYYRRGINQNDPTIVEEMRRTYAEDDNTSQSFVTTSARVASSPALCQVEPAATVHAWPDVLAHLNEAASRIRVLTINGGSADALNYVDHPEGLSVIAVGGDKLSRGLTLEGLSVSYYLRTSEMYDTLMQMGRWFGYRPGYADLCRLFTSRGLNEWFCHITLASEELRDEFDYMANLAGSTPREYALRVRTHPGNLQVTAANKFRNAVSVRFSFAGRLVETYEFPTDIEVLQRNYDHVQRIVVGLGAANSRIGGHYIWEEVSPQQVIQFLENYRTTDKLHRADSQSLIRFINLQLPTGELTEWTVVLLSNPRPVKPPVSYNMGGIDTPIHLFYRERQKENSGPHIYYLRKSHIISPGHEFIDLTPEQYDQALEMTEELRRKNGKTGRPQYPNGDIVRNRIRDKRKALLLLYSLDSAAAQAGLPADLPVTGYAISFPGSNHNNAVDYAIHGDLLERFREQVAAGDDDEEEGNDND